MPVDLIIFAVIALFFLFKLGGVLGKKTGHQQRPDFPADTRDDAKPGKTRAAKDDDNVVRLPKSFDEPEPESPHLSGPAGDGLRAIADADPDFDPDSFLEGAQAAFEMIVNAYAEGDRKTLKNLLDKATYEGFAGAIDGREKSGERMEDTLVGIDSTEFEEADLQGSTAQITLRFVSQQVNVTYDSEGRVIDGDPSKVMSVVDIWTFARSVKSRNPNWQLVETRNAG